jgi:hypothetical protein
MTDRELLQQALAMLEDINQCSLPPTGIPLPAEIDEVMEALRARLAQPEPKPITMVVSKTGDPSVTMSWWHEPALPVGTPLYTVPPQRKWAGLTDAEYEAMAEQYVTNCYFDTLKYAKAIEAKLRDKNS